MTRRGWSHGGMAVGGGQRGRRDAALDALAEHVPEASEHVCHAVGYDSDSTSLTHICRSVCSVVSQALFFKHLPPHSL